MRNNLVEYCKKRAAQPRQSLKQLLLGTLFALISMLALVGSSEWQNEWLFYGLSFCLFVSVSYALPGYFGIWLWRMRKFLFDMD